MATLDNEYTNSIVLRRMKKALIATIAAIILVFGIWYAWFQGIPNLSASYEFASSRPEGKLYYPSARVISRFGQSQDKIKGNRLAIAGAVLVSQDSPKKIYQWYHTWLTAHGWHEDKNLTGGLLDTQTSLRSYAKENKRETFYVAMNDPKSLGMTMGKKIPTNTTVFEINYFIK